MLCRIVVTTIAISCTFSREIIVHDRDQGSSRLAQIKDVICVLLLSGLQKEDLDTNTLQKLQRHNVNFYDMNNESLRQECLLKTLVDAEKGSKTFEITEAPNITTDNKQNNIERSNLANIQKSEENDMLDNNNNQRNLAEEISFSQRETHSNENLNISNVKKSNLDDMDITTINENKKQQNEYIKSQPSLESVLKFWNKLTQNRKSEKLTEINQIKEIETTTSILKPKNENKFHYKNMGYINGMIAKYLESQTEQTTTQKNVIKTSIDIISSNIDDILIKNDNLNILAYLKDEEDTNGNHVKEINNSSGIGKIFQTYHNHNGKDLTSTNIRIFEKEMNSGDIDSMKKSQPYGSLVNFSLKSETDNKSALQYMTDLLNVKNKYKHKAQISFTEGTFTTIYNSPQTESVPKGDSEIINKTKSSNDQFKGVSADIIQDIADKIKEIVMKDIRKYIQTTERSTSLSTSTSSTTTATTTVKPTTLQSNESNVIQTLMELFKEFKTMKDATKTTTSVPLKSTTSYKIISYNTSLNNIFPPMTGDSYPYGVNTSVANVKPTHINPYSQNAIPMPYGQLLQTLNGLPYPNTISQNNEYRMLPVPIQTNSAEIPPLAIKVSKATKLMNQHIIVTTQNPFKIKRHRSDIEQQYNYKNIKTVEEENQHADNPTYAELSKQLQIAENVKNDFRESYKDRIEKLKQRIKYAHDRNRDRTHELSHPLNDHGSLGIGSGHHDKRNRPYDSYNRDNSKQEVTFRLQEFMTKHRPLNEPTNINQHETLDRLDDSGYRDFITRGALSRLGDQNQRDVINEMIITSPHINKPIDAYNRYDQERSHPRYTATKFHERLEQIENRPQNSYEAFSTTTENCYDPVVAREQMPLTKFKQYPRIDDTRFSNFLKSQQKVNEMLESILAAKTKVRQSDELP